MGRGTGVISKDDPSCQLKGNVLGVRAWGGEGGGGGRGSNYNTKVALQKILLARGSCSGCVVRGKEVGKGGRATTTTHGCLTKDPSS